MKWEVARERSGKWDTMWVRCDRDKKVSGVVCHHLVMKVFCMMLGEMKSDAAVFVKTHLK